MEIACYHRLLVELKLWASPRILYYDSIGSLELIALTFHIILALGIMLLLSSK
jgi:hypothetical protein